MLHSNMANSDEVSPSSLAADAPADDPEGDGYADGAGSLLSSYIRGTCGYSITRGYAGTCSCNGTVY